MLTLFQFWGSRTTYSASFRKAIWLNQIQPDGMIVITYESRYYESSLDCHGLAI